MKKTFFCIIIPIALIMFCAGMAVDDQKLYEALNCIVLTSTLFALIWYAIDTNRLANQSEKANLSSMRPLILRSGFLDAWGSVGILYPDGNPSVPPISFMIYNNVATDISGFVVIDKFSFPLFFSHQSASTALSAKYQPQWGWVQAGGSVNAYGVESGKKPSDKPNQIHVSYKDIEGNEYYTIEDSNFSQKSFPKQ